MTGHTGGARRDGFALMAALWLVVLVGATGYELSVRSRTRRLAVANALEQVQAQAAAEAGLETVRAELEQRLAHPLLDRTQRMADAVADPWANLSLLPADTIQLGDERTSAHVVDAGTRLQVNRATEGDIRRLLEALPMDASVADRLAQRIVDWRDADDFPRARGAERADYLRAGARVLPANADFDQVEELRSIDGMTPDVYRRIAPYLSVRGSGQINLNAAPRTVLLALPGLTEEVIDALLRARQDRQPVRSLGELAQRVSSGARAALASASAELAARAVFDTREVEVQATGWLDGSPVHVRASALYQRSGDALMTWRRTDR